MEEIIQLPGYLVKIISVFILVPNIGACRILEPSLEAVGWEPAPGEGNRAQTRAALIDRLGEEF